MKSIITIIAALALAGCTGEWTPEPTFQIPRPDLITDDAFTGLVTVGTAGGT